jgi:hypothetical protein
VEKRWEDGGIGAWVGDEDHGCDGEAAHDIEGEEAIAVGGGHDHGRRGSGGGEDFLMRGGQRTGFLRDVRSIMPVRKGLRKGLC